MKPNAAIAAAISAEKPAGPKGNLEKLQEAAARARSLELEISDLEARLKEKRTELYAIYHVELPDLMDEAGVDHIGLPAAGNLPAMDAELKPYYSANIAASWPEERRKAAFQYLTNLGHSELIKTDVVASFSRGHLKTAQKLFAQASKLKGVAANMKEAVHSGTLTAWLKEQVEVHHQTPNLELIGGSIGRVVKMKERKDG